MSYIEEEGASDSHGSTHDEVQESDASSGGSVTTTFGGAHVGDLIQWESQGVLKLEQPRRVRLVTDDGKWVAVEGSETGIPMNEVIVEEHGSTSDQSTTAPQFPISDAVADEGVAGKGTDIRLALGKGVVVQIRSPDELGEKDFGKLLKLLEAQQEALKE